MTYFYAWQLTLLNHSTNSVFAVTKIFLDYIEKVEKKEKIVRLVLKHQKIHSKKNGDDAVWNNIQ